MKKIKKLFVVLAAGMALMLPVQAMAAVDLNAKYEISTNQIQGWPAGPEIISDTGILMDADTEWFFTTKVRMSRDIRQVLPRL